jgi:hypothetical protein
MNISVLVGTCDSYLKFVPNFVSLANKYFEPNVERIIIGETIKEEYGGYKFITPGKLQWGERMLVGLNEVKTKYVFFALEDYYLSQKLSVDFISWLMQFMGRENAKKLMLSCVPDFAQYQYSRTIDTIKQMSPRSNWLASIQPAIWDVEHLKSIILPEYSPWDFEIKASEILRHHEMNHYVIKLDEPIYFNFVRKGGVLSDGWSQFLNNEGLKLTN